jgi:hypothetical protein
VPTKPLSVDMDTHLDGGCDVCHVPSFQAINHRENKKSKEQVLMTFLLLIFERKMTVLGSAMRVFTYTFNMSKSLLTRVQYVICSDVYRDDNRVRKTGLTINTDWV